VVVLIKFLKIKTMESLYSKSIEELRNISDGNKEKKNDIYMVDPRYIVIKNGHNSRNFEDEKVKEHIIGLRESIRERGLLTPLLCRRGEQCGNYIDDNGKEHPLYQWITIDGECRLRAVNMLLDEGYEIDRIEVRSQRRNSNDADDMLDMFTSNQGLPFTEYESAITFKRFINLFKWDVQKIAKKTGKSPTYIYNALKLLDYNEVIQTNLNDKVILPNDVRKIAKEVKESVKNNKTNLIEEKEKLLYPGYVYVNMNLDRDGRTWYVVRNTPRVTGILGSSGKLAQPVPVPQKDMDSIFSKIGRVEVESLEHWLGKWVELIEGSLKGTKLKVIDFDDKKGKIFCEYELLGSYQKLELEPKYVKLVK